MTLVATNLPGIYSTSRPHAHPQLRARFAELGLTSANQIVPEMRRATAMHRRRRGPQRRELASPSASIQMTNVNGVWAGAAVTGTGLTSATGTWNVPASGAGLDDPIGTDGWLVSCWVGLDGYGDGELLQCGVAPQTNDDGSVGTPWPWYEWWIENAPAGSPAYVDAQTVPNFPVATQDKICALAEYFTDPTGARKGRLTMTNLTTQLFWSIELDPPPNVTMPGNSAEWIVEDYNGGYPDHSLALFTPCNFSQCSCATATTTSVAGDGEEMEIARADGTQMTSVLNLHPGSDGFNIGYYKYNID